MGFGLSFIHWDCTGKSNLRALFLRSRCFCEVITRKKRPLFNSPPPSFFSVSQFYCLSVGIAAHLTLPLVRIQNWSGISFLIKALTLTLSQRERGQKKIAARRLVAYLVSLITLFTFRNRNIFFLTSVSSHGTIDDED